MSSVCTKRQTATAITAPPSPNALPVPGRAILSRSEKLPMPAEADRGAAPMRAVELEFKR
jgi:hypothetical protein